MNQSNYMNKSNHMSCSTHMDEENYMCENNYVSRSNRMNSKNELAEIIMQASFAIDDIKLYLDTHPCDKEAIKTYRDYKKIRNMAWEEHTKHFGPLSAYDVDVDNYWNWVNDPWPWEGVC